jgi:hypothetical protein
MAKSNKKSKSRRPIGKKTLLPGMVRISPAGKLPENFFVVPIDSPTASSYQFKYTTGPVLLTQNTRSLDWGILNNDSTNQKVRVTVFKCITGTVKTIESPGPLEVTLLPGQASHNANNAVGGFFYEIQVECNSQKVFPHASAWDGYVGNPIAGTVVLSGSFIQKLS